MKVWLGTGSDVIEIDAAALPLFSKYRWWIIRYGKINYAQARVNGVKVTLHRLIMKPPAGMVVDHIDGNGLNNKRSNLRIVTQGQNLLNRAHAKVAFAEGRWRAQLRLGEKRVHLGFFETEKAARQARAYATKLLRGSLARDEGVDMEGFDPLSLSPTARRVLLDASACSLAVPLPAL